MKVFKTSLVSYYLYICSLIGTKIAYQWENLPDFIRIGMPLKGSQKIFTQEVNIVRIPQTMFVYMVCLDEELCDIADWVYTRYQGYFITINETVDASTSALQKIYRKILPAGTYEFMTQQAAYLFQDDTGTLFSNLNTFMGLLSIPKMLAHL